MGTVQVELDQDLVDLLEELHRPVKQAARELIVLELYRQGEVSSGKAAELLGLGPSAALQPASPKTRRLATAIHLPARALPATCTVFGCMLLSWSRRPLGKL